MSRPPMLRGTDRADTMGLGRLGVFAGAILFALGTVGAHAADGRKGLKEDYLREPMPPGFQVVVTELEGPVFADVDGHTLYKWTMRQLFNGAAGDPPNKTFCTDAPSTEAVGLQSPYPGGNLLPDADRRPTCVKQWPPMLA